MEILERLFSGFYDFLPQLDFPFCLRQRNHGMRLMDLCKNVLVLAIQTLSLSGFRCDTAGLNLFFFVLRWNRVPFKTLLLDSGQSLTFPILCIVSCHSVPHFHDDKTEESLNTYRHSAVLCC